jgi:hypothetical protein
MKPPNDVNPLLSCAKAGMDAAIAKAPAAATARQVWLSIGLPLVSFLPPYVKGRQFIFPDIALLPPRGGGGQAKVGLYGLNWTALAAPRVVVFKV